MARRPAPAGADDVEHRIAGQAGEAADGAPSCVSVAWVLVMLSTVAASCSSVGALPRLSSILRGPGGQADAVDGAAHVLADGGQVFGAAGAAVAEGAETTRRQPASRQ